jgi:hypothetical protein
MRRTGKTACGAVYRPKRDRRRSAGRERVAGWEAPAGSGSLPRAVASQFAKTLSQAVSRSWSHSSGTNESAGYTTIR